MATGEIPLVNAVEHAVGNHLDAWDHAGQLSALDLLAETVTATALSAVPDGWARIEREWVKLPDTVYASLVDDEHPGDDDEGGD